MKKQNPFEQMQRSSEMQFERSTFQRNQDYNPNVSIKIPSVSYIKKSHYFKIDIYLKDSKSADHTVSKTFNNFHQLQDDLLQEGYINIPDIPGKTLFSVSSQEGLLKRQKDLEMFLNLIAAKSELLNSREYIRFMELDRFKNNLLVNCPQLLV